MIRESYYTTFCREFQQQQQQHRQQQQQRQSLYACKQFDTRYYTAIIQLMLRYINEITSVQFSIQRKDGRTRHNFLAIASG